MPLEPGQKLSHYRLVEKIGEGGMGVVWRARDTRLDRDVALKVLPEAFTSDADRLARFEREAKVLASLNHPNIGSIHGLEEADGVKALVLELVEGPTLADRIAEGPIPLDEALPIARQVAEAFEAAHEQGIIHRDLKPANVKLKPDGTVKVLDFGLAKALQPNVSDPDLSQSPTLTAGATRMGAILGTAAYMAPEQARGEPVDERADIWAFGCVLYEMLTSSSAFLGPTVTDLLAAVIKEEPDWGILPGATPSAVRRLLYRCLRKDPRKRLHHMGDVRLDLDDVLGQPDVERTAGPGIQSFPSRFRWLAALVGILVLAALAVWIFESRQPTEPPALMRFTIPVSNAGNLSISPDGQQLAYASLQGGETVAYIRQLNSATSRKLDTGHDVLDIAWAPDNRHIAVSGGGKLSKFHLDDGRTQLLCGLPAETPERATRGISWNDHGTIIFSTGQNPLHRVDASGGKPEPVTVLDPARGEFAHTWPQFLPDQDHFIFFAQSRQAENNGIHVGSLTSSETSLLLKTNLRATFSRPNHLLFVHNGILQVRRLNLAKMVLEDESFPIAGGIAAFSAFGAAEFSSSDTGVLVYKPSDGLAAKRDLMWFDRKGNQLGSVGESAFQFIVNLSPDESRLVTTRVEDGNSNIWITNIARNVALPFGREPSGEFDPQWSPDGSRIAFTSDRGGPMALFVKSMSQDSAELLQASGSDLFMCDWSNDGRYIIYHENQLKLLGLSLSGDGEPFVVLETPYVKDQAQFSPSTRWIAYNAKNTGRHEVYVTSFPAGGEEIPVSRDGGMQPRWRGDGRELFFLDPESRLMSVEVKEVADHLELGAPREVFKTHVEAWPHVELYDVTRDGQRFIMMVPVESLTSQLNVVVNWTSVLEE